jgi:hypothetical protein
MIKMVKLMTLTHATQPLFAEADQHVQTHVTIGRFAEMFQTPHVVAVLFEGIVDTCGMGEKG